jgi:3-oxoacyl-[acyl-carrier protein] reductase
MPYNPNFTDQKTRLDGQVAVVTGGSQGIGRSIAQLLTVRGAQVINWDRQLLSESEKADFEPVHTEIVDVSDYDSVETAFQAVERKFGQIHILINNAGINGPIKPTWEYPLEDWDRVIAIDMTSVFFTSRLAAAHMRAHRYGRILTISSMAGKEGVVNLCAYSAAKAGVIGFSKALSKEVCEHSVTVNCIAPALTDTPLLDGMTDEHITNMKAKIPMGRLAQVAEVAELAAWVASPACSFTTGFVFDLSGGRATY